MTTCVSINGRLQDEESAFVSVLDRGFLYGDSVFEVLRTSRGSPVDQHAHLERLHRSARSIAIRCPPTQELEHAIGKTLRAANNSESHIRIIVTRGDGAGGLAITGNRPPTVIVVVSPLLLPEESQYRQGIAVQFVSVERTPRSAIDPSIKSGNYLNNILALQQAQGNGAQEAIMCDREGRVAEGSTSNIFFVSHGKIVTPSEEVGLLPGITRARVFVLARQRGLEITETTFFPAQLRTADEAFITSSIRGVMPVRSVDGVPYPHNCPGATTTILMELYKKFLSEHGEG